jgi:hypothetical protein
MADMTGKMVQPNMGYKNPGPTDNLRGVERNTARGVTVPQVLTGVTEIEYAPCTDAPQVTPYRTHED